MADQSLTNGELAVEIRYMRQEQQELKAQVTAMSAVLTQLQIRSASHATVFGIFGGILTAAGSYLSSKFLGQ